MTDLNELMPADLGRSCPWTLLNDGHDGPNGDDGLRSWY